MIKIKDDIYIDADDNCFMIITWNGKLTKRGELQNARRRYYSTPIELMRGLFTILIKRAVMISSNLSELSASLNEIADMFERISAEVEILCGKAVGRYGKARSASLE